MTDPETQPTNTPPRVRRWFAVGFLVVFVGMMLFVTQYTPYRDGVLQCKLWRFYFIEFRRALGPVRPLGLGSGSGAHAVQILATHLAVSAVAGFVAMGIGAVVRRRPST